jgi:hypothetical protein
MKTAWMQAIPAISHSAIPVLFRINSLNFGPKQTPKTPRNTLPRLSTEFMCEQLKRNTKDQLSCTIATGSTMRLDSSAPTVSGEWLWQMRLVSVVQVRDRSPMEVAADGLEHRLRRFRVANGPGVNGDKRVRTKPLPVVCGNSAIDYFLWLGSSLGLT